jgi:hypothetical protein
MPLTIVDKTPVSPTSVDSEGYVAFRDLGPRPICGTCFTDDNCPECGNDKPYLQPVVAGDLIYLQFRNVDDFNMNPELPDAGWKNGSDPFWIEAKLIFSSGAELELDSQNIIAGKEVGWFKGSYQNLILNSQKIQDYLNTIPLSDNCFSVEVKTYKSEYPEYTLVRGFAAVLPDASGFLNGTLFAVDGVVYENVDGSWEATELLGTLIFSVNQGGFFEYAMDEYISTTLEPVKVDGVVCSSKWFKFVNCEQTIIIEGLHGESDCEGQYFGGRIRFRDRYRLYASFEQIGFRTDKETNENDVVTSFNNYERWLLRLMQGVPNSWARRINNTLLGSQVFIDNNEYVNFSDLERNNDTGLSWWSQVSCERDNCNKTQGCEEAIFTNPIVICETPDCPEVGEPVILSGELGDYSDTAACGSIKVIPAATVEDTEGNVLGQVDAGQTLVVDCSGGEPSGECDDAIVQNSDASFEQAIASGDTYTLEDYTVNLYLDAVLVDTDTAPAMTDITINVNWV